MRKVLTFITESMWAVGGIEIKFAVVKALCEQYVYGYLPARERYLDVGAGNGALARAVGRGFLEVWGLDLKFWSYPGDRDEPWRELLAVRASGEVLPFKNGSFDLVTSFSVLEHIRNQQQALREWVRVLKPGGVLLVQIPNRYFFVELHSSLPNPNFLPRGLRNSVLRAIGYEWLTEIDIPTPGRVKGIVLGTDHAMTCKIVPIAWPPSMVHPKLRGPYQLLGRLQLFRIAPLGYMVVCRKPPPNL